MNPVCRFKHIGWSQAKLHHSTNASILHPQAGSQVGSVVFEIPQSFQSVEVGSAHCQSALVIFSWKTRVLHSSFGITPQRSKAMGLWYFWLEPPMPCNLVHGLWRVLSWQFHRKIMKDNFQKEVQGKKRQATFRVRTQMLVLNDVHEGQALLSRFDSIYLMVW